MKLTIIVPAYNEEETVKGVIERLRGLSFDKEIIVVDDGSTDGTVEALSSIESGDFRLLKHERNQGKGSAIQTGLRHAAGDLVTVQDADLEYNPEEFPLLMKLFEDEEVRVVYGSRFKGGRNFSWSSFYFGNRFLTWLTNVLYMSSLTDMETCYKMFRREVVEDLEIKARRFDVEPEITAKVLRRGEKIHEVPITYLPRSRKEGKKVNWKDGIPAVKCLFKYRFTGCRKSPGKAKR